MPVRIAPVLACLCVVTAASTAGCYASHQPAEDDASDGGCALPTELVSPLVERTRVGHCTLEGPDRRRTIWRSDCDGVTCTMSVDGVSTCTCDTLDFVNTCSNGVPTCLGWAIFDYTHVTFENDD